MRHGHREDLVETLKEICSPQDGLWIILGLQPAAKSCIPEIIFTEHPEDQWIEITGLDRAGVVEIINQNTVVG